MINYAIEEGIRVAKKVAGRVKFAKGSGYGFLEREGEEDIFVPVPVLLQALKGVEVEFDLDTWYQ